MLLALTAWTAAGAATWTLLEYVIHRGLGHVRTQNAFGHEHTRHHATTHYFASWGKKAAASLPVIASFAALASLVLGPAPGLAFAGGLAAMYALYELLHRRAHTHAPRGPYGRWLRRHHFHHHFHAPASNFGVTSPVWDLVFRTRERPGTIRVPEKHAMAWLTDERGQVRPAFAAEYAIVARRRAAAPVPAATSA